jgi:hypothetical protein
MLTLVMLAVLLPQVQTALWTWSIIDGQQWKSEVSETQVLAAPRWTTDGPVPLTPDGAVRSAKRILPVMAKQLENWQVDSIVLVRAAQSYVYEVHFGEVSPRPGVRQRQTAA